MFIDALARFDHRAGTTDYRDIVTDSIQATVNAFDITYVRFFMCDMFLCLIFVIDK